MSQHDSDIAAIARISAVPTILKVISEMSGLRLALIARVTQDQWTACAVLDRMDFGLEVGGTLEVATTLCSEVRDSHEPIIIEHASAEPAFCDHPTPKMYGFESYIAIPIFRKSGEYFGNVCALDSRPALLRAPKTLAMMELFAELISLQLTAEEDSVRDREALVRAEETAELREQFIAVLGHDLRNPLFAVLAGSGHLLHLEQPPTHRVVLERIQSAGRRMVRLIDDIMDLARGRMGSGIAIARDRVAVAALVQDVVAEIASAHPDRTLRTQVSDVGSALLDRARIAQLLSNLVANAVQHSDAASPVDIACTHADGTLVFRVSNRGRPIPADVLPRLFQPYVRGNGPSAHSGLGLGLYIASEVAQAHGGRIDVASSDDGLTCFTVTLPSLRSARFEVAQPDIAEPDRVRVVL